MKSNFVVFRLADDEAIYLADLEAGTLERRRPDETAGMDRAEATRDVDGPTLKGLDLRPGVKRPRKGAGHYFLPNR